MENKLHHNKTVIVTGAATGIGKSIAQELAKEGANVVGADINPVIKTNLNGKGLHARVIDLVNEEQTRNLVAKTVERFGGIDILVSNAGIFKAGKMIEEMDDETWNQTININLTSHQRMLRLCIPYLKKGKEPTAIFIGSRNYAAPGAGASAYSVSKAGITQLARVAALELARYGIRVNVIHPDAVFDTNIWTPEVLKKSADRYGLSIDEYKKKNLMKTEITSSDVADVVSVIASKYFLKTTGAQIPVDGGNDRVI